MNPSVLAVCFFTSPGPVADNFETLCRSLALQSRLSILTSNLLKGRAVPGADAACYVNVSKTQPFRWLSPSLWREVREFVRRREFDLLFIYSEHPLHVPVRMLSRARRTLFWCLDPTSHSGGRALFAAVYELAKRSLVTRADRIAVACQALKREVCARYRIPEDRVITSFHGVLENLVFPDLPVPVNRDIDILFFGRRYRYKGLDVLLEAIRQLRARGRDPKVLIAGQGPEAVGETPGVSVLDRYVPDRELAQLVARARVVVMPYRDATGSQVPQTAFAYGTPVVASAVGCLAEYVEDGVTGLLVPPGDAESLAGALDRLLGDAGLWGSFSRNAEDRARRTFANGPLTARLLADALG